jgi:PIN domain nuclease of toxin-antitoxin system
VKLLLDTQCWLWWFNQPERLNEDVREYIADESNELWFSVASIWEMGIKAAIGKLPLPEPVDSYVSSRIVRLGTITLDITASHALQASALPPHHKDPFDRMLIAQAQIENMMLVSADSIFSKYDVSIVEASKS